MLLDVLYTCLMGQPWPVAARRDIKLHSFIHSFMFCLGSDLYFLVEWEEELTHSVIPGKDILDKNPCRVSKDDAINVRVRTGGRSESYTAKVIAIGK